MVVKMVLLRVAWWADLSAQTMAGLMVELMAAL